MTIPLFRTNWKKNKKSKPLGASLFQQKRWAMMKPSQKSFNRLLLPDRDGDKVPDLFDCQPFNRKKQEKFILKKKAVLPYGVAAQSAETNLINVSLLKGYDEATNNKRLFGRKKVLPRDKYTKLYADQYQTLDKEGRREYKVGMISLSPDTLRREVIHDNEFGFINDPKFKKAVEKRTKLAIEHEGTHMVYSEKARIGTRPKMSNKTYEETKQAVLNKLTADNFNPVVKEIEIIDEEYEPEARKEEMDVRMVEKYPEVVYGEFRGDEEDPFKYVKERKKGKGLRRFEIDDTYDTVYTKDELKNPEPKPEVLEDFDEIVEEEK